MACVPPEVQPDAREMWAEQERHEATCSLLKSGTARAHTVRGAGPTFEDDDETVHDYRHA